MSDDLETSRRIEIIKDLILEEEAVGEPVIYRVTVLQSMIEYERTYFPRLEDLQEAVLRELQITYPFSPRPRSRLNEGFFQYSKADNKIDCYYIREQPFRWDYADVERRSIDSLILKRVDPTFRVRMNIAFEPNTVVMAFFGGSEALVFRAREIVCQVVRKHLYNFSTKHVRFDAKAMRDILERFGKYVELINIDPRDNEKFTKIIEERVRGKADVRRVIVYDVYNVRMTGISITISPEVTRLIEQEGIRLTEIRGGLWLGIGIRITTKVKANGRVEFIIPSKYFGSDVDELYDAAVKLYGRIVPSDLEPERGPLERFL